MSDDGQYPLPMIAPAGSPDERAHARANKLQIVATAAATLFIVTVVLYGLNHQDEGAAGETTATEQSGSPAPQTADNQQPQAGQQQSQQQNNSQQQNGSQPQGNAQQANNPPDNQGKSTTGQGGQPDNGAPQNGGNNVTTGTNGNSPQAKPLGPVNAPSSEQPANTPQ